MNDRSYTHTPEFKQWFNKQVPNPAITQEVSAITANMRELMAQPIVLNPMEVVGLGALLEQLDQKTTAQKQLIRAQVEQEYEQRRVKREAEVTAECTRKDREHEQKAVNLVRMLLVMVVIWAITLTWAIHMWYAGGK